MASNARSSRGGKNAGVKVADKFKEACPPQKWKDLEQLVKQHNGDEDAIQARIMEWWEEKEAAPKEELWENVNKKKPKNKYGGGQISERSGRGRGGGGPSGRGGRGSGGYRGRGGSAFHGGRGGRHAGDRKPREPREPKPGDKKPKSEEANAPVPGVTPSDSTEQNGAAAPPEEVVEPEPTKPAPAVESFVSSSDPTPSGRPVSTVRQPKAVIPSGGGNVWATKGSAHLIQAEKPKPPPVAPVQPKSKPRNVPLSKKPGKGETSSSSQDPSTAEPQPLSPDLPLPAAPAAPLADTLKDDMDKMKLESEETPAPVSADQTETDTLLSEASNAVGLPASINGANVNAAGWKPMLNENGSVADLVPSADEPKKDEEEIMEAAPKEIPAPVPVVSPQLSSTAAPSLPPQEIVTTSAPATKSGQGNVLNMGRWDVKDGDEQAMNFGFGGFGSEKEDKTDKKTESKPTNGLPAVVTEKVTAAKEAAAATTLSPARPPPGLGLGGGAMPPMPAGAVLVHELEGKLDRQSLEPTKPKEEVVEVVSKGAEPPRDEPKPPAPAPPSQEPSSAVPPTSNVSVPTTSVPAPAPGMTAPQSAGMYPNAGYGAPGMANMYSAYNSNLGGAFMGGVGVGGIPGLLTPQQQQAQQHAAQQAAQQGPKGGPPFGPSDNKDDATDNTAPSTTAGSTGGTQANSSSIASTGPSALNNAFPPGMMAYNPAAAFGGGFYGQHAGYPHHQMAGQGLSANVNLPYGAYGGYPPAQFGGGGGYASAYQQQLAAQMGVGGGVGGPPGSNQGGSLGYGLGGGYGDNPGGNQNSSGEPQHLGLGGVGGSANDSRGVGTGYGNKSNYRGNRNNQSNYNQGGGYGSQSQYNPTNLHQQHTGLGYGGGGISNPYGMGGYGSQGMDHFQAQRGYGGVGVGLHSSAHNPYGMQQQTNYGGQGLGGGFGQDAGMDPMDARGGHNKNKGNKGPRGGGFGGHNNGPPQFQQAPPFGGLQSQGPDHGSGGASSGGGNSSAGWGQQSWGGTGSGQSWQHGGGN